MLAPRAGPTIEIDAPTPAEMDWIFAALQRPDIYIPLSLPEPPSRDELDSGRIRLHDEEGIGVHPAGFLIARRRNGGEAVAFLMHYGWSNPRDTTRELDIAVPEQQERALGMFLECHIVSAVYMFGHNLAKRIRWRAELAGDRPLRWYERLGARSAGTIHEPHPQTGEMLHHHVYEVSKTAFLAVLAGVGVRLEDDYDTWGISMWDLLRGAPR
jgi:hypothetical protein